MWVRGIVIIGNHNSAFAQVVTASSIHCGLRLEYPLLLTVLCYYQPLNSLERGWSCVDIM